MKSPKIWVPLIVSIFALGLSGYAIYVDNVHYQEVTKPHTKHDEIYNRLVRLDDKIGRAEQSISVLQDAGQDINGPQENLSKVKELRDQAELAWDEGNYIEADRLIREAHDVLQEIPSLAFPLNWWLIGGIMAVVVAVIVFIWLNVIRRRTGE